MPTLRTLLPTLILLTSILLMVPSLRAQTASLTDASAEPSGRSKNIPVVLTPEVRPRETTNPEAARGPGALTFFTDSDVFDMTFPGLRFEDFDNAMVNPQILEICPAPLGNLSNNLCFAPGGITTGLRFGEPGDTLSIVGVGGVGNATKLLGTAFALDTLEITFDPPVSAVGMDVFTVTGLGVSNDHTMILEYFDVQGSSLGTTTTGPASRGVFSGVSSPAPIARANLRSSSTSAEYVTKLRFDGAPALELVGASLGDGCVANPGQENTLVEPGETISFQVDLGGFIMPFTGITGTLTSSTPGITFIADTSAWPDTAPGQTATNENPFVFKVATDATCLGMVDFELNVTTNEGPSFALTLTEAIGSKPVPDVPQPIPVAPMVGRYPLEIPDDFVLTDVDVRVEIDQPGVGDLVIKLEAPDGTEVVLLDRPGFPTSQVGCRRSDMNVTFDDDSTFDPEDHCPTVNPWLEGPARPVGNLAAFNGLSSAGTWTLEVFDALPTFGLGAVVDFELITTPPIPANCSICPPAADLGLAQSTVPGTPVVAGEVLTLTLEVSNFGPDDAQSVTVTDDLPPPLEYLSDDCGGSFAAPTFSWTIPTLAASDSASCNLSLQVAAGAPTADVLNTATVSSTTFDPVTGNETSQATLAILGSSNLTLAKTSDPVTARREDPVTFSLEVINNGPSPASDVVVTDDLPTAFDYVSNDCGATFAGPTLTWIVGDLAPGASTVCAVQTTVAPLASPGDVVNTATASATESDPVIEDNVDSATVSILAVADLQLGQDTVPGTPVVAGETLTLTLEVSNLGPDDAQSVTVVDDLPSTLEYLSDDCGGSFAAPTFSWTIPTLAAFDNASCNLSLRVVADAPTGDVLNTASVSSTTIDPEPNNDASQATIAILGSSNLTLVKTSDPMSAQPEDPVTFFLTILNNGPSPASDVVVTDDLPTAFEYVSNDCVATFAGSTLTWNVGDLASGESASCAVQTNVAPLAGPGDVVNTATASATESDPVTTDNASTATISIARILPTEIPTLHELGLLILAALLSVVALRRMRVAR